MRPLKHIRVCQRCDVVRWAPCSVSCAIDARSQWEPNVQWTAADEKRERGGK
nr:hypothetical protein [Mycobacterium eburneum]